VSVKPTGVALVGVLLQLVLALGEPEVVGADNGVESEVTAADFLASIAVAESSVSWVGSVGDDMRLTRGRASRFRRRLRR
jgi:hypothetical protein